MIILTYTYQTHYHADQTLLFSRPTSRYELCTRCTINHSTYLYLVRKFESVGNFSRSGPGNEYRAFYFWRLGRLSPWNGRGDIRSYVLVPTDNHYNYIPVLYTHECNIPAPCDTSKYYLDNISPCFNIPGAGFTQEYCLNCNSDMYI